MLIASALALAVLSGVESQPRPITGGFCAGKVWIRLAPGERAEFALFTDSWVYKVRNRRGKNWTAGGYSNGPPVNKHLGVGPIVFRRSGYVVRRAPFFDDVGHIGKSYLLNMTGVLPSGEEISYYNADTVILSGTAFSWTVRDGAIFDRIYAGAEADHKCSLFRKTR